MGVAALVFFLSNGVLQLPNLASVTSYTCSENWWVLIGLVVVEVLVLMGFVGIKVVERNLDGPKKKRR
jgi:hypothetical protein